MKQYFKFIHPVIWIPIFWIGIAALSALGLVTGLGLGRCMAAIALTVLFTLKH